MVFRFPSWSKALIGIVAIKAILSLAVKPGSFVVSYGGISYFLLLLTATGFALRNAVRNTLRSRPFWALLAIGYGLWALHQFLNLYYELGLHTDVPDSSISDPILFLHVALILAAVATRPHRTLSDRTLRSGILGSLFVPFVLAALYGFSVVCYRYLSTRTTMPGSGLGFDTFYLAENLALILALTMVAFRTRLPWKAIYSHLLGASMLYTLSSTLANFAIDSGGYLNGKLYGVGLTASVCWFVWIPLGGEQLAEPELRTGRSENRRGSRASGWAMLLVVLIAIPIMWELLHRDEDATERALRLVVAIAAITCLVSAAYVKEYLAKRELASRVSVADDRLHLALKAGAAAAWDLDVRSGRDLWFGELQTIFGISSDTYAATVKEFFQRVHPDDRQRVSEAVFDAKKNRKPYAAEFRVVHQDGTFRWLTSRGKFYYGPNGNPERMLGVSLDITERRRAEQALRESEAKFRNVFQDAGVGMVIVSPEGYFLAANATFCDYLGYTEEELLAKSVESVTYHEDWPALSNKLREALEGDSTIRRLEKRCLHKSGRIIYTESSASLIRDSADDPQYFVGEVVDITKRKESEEALSSVNRRLIRAQEEERIRIARDLHDDIGQRLALFAIRLSQLQEYSAVSPSDLPSHIGQMQQELEDLSSGVQNLSHELHSSKLDYLGVAPAMRSWCKEFGQKQNLEIDFESNHVPNSVPPEVALSLFRVLQEALHNAAKHSGVKHFNVQLRANLEEINLTVNDLGVGFDTEATVQGQGLGLISMRERLRLVNGDLTIESQPKCGTTIYARVPFFKGESAASAG